MEPASLACALLRDLVSSLNQGTAGWPLCYYLCLFNTHVHLPRLSLSCSYSYSCSIEDPAVKRNGLLSYQLDLDMGAIFHPLVRVYSAVAGLASC